MTTSTCYMCEAPATSREHVPPSGLFPGQGAVGRDLRRNLITVPSCDLHNSQKSEDDEYLRTVLCLPAADSSSAAAHHFNDKVRRAARRSPAKYSLHAPEANVPAPPGKVAFKVDRKRFDRCIDHIARALCFHVYKRKWQLPFVVASPQMLRAAPHGGLSIPAPWGAAMQLTRDVLAAEPVHGENPEVFVYRIKLEGDVLAFAARFYETVEVYAASSLVIADIGDR